ncbi:hypothetical protein EMCRGX_G023666 [Ephydatia muelleri]
MTTRSEYTTTEDIFSDTYLDAFYKAHVASRRGNIEEDIAAIEAEIQKVKQYRSRFLSYRCENQAGSCGSSECSDDQTSGDEEFPMESPTSVFRVYNSSSRQDKNVPRGIPRGPNIFTWATAQQVAHDHTYCSPSSTASHMPIDQGSLSLENICWDQLPPQKRVQVLNRLHAILKHLPSEDLLPFPSCSSLDMIPHSLANTIRKYSSIGITSASTSKNNKSPAHLTQGSSRIDIKEIKSKQRPSQSPPVEHNSPNPQGHAQKRLRHAPYGGRPSKSTPSHLSETTRCASNGSSCSDDSDVVID